MEALFISNGEFQLDRSSSILSLQNQMFFNKLYITYFDKIKKYIQFKGVHIVDVEDITSQVFLKAMECYSTFEDRGVSFGSWLYRVAHNEVMQLHRTNKKYHFQDASELQDEIEVENSMEELEQFSNVLACLNELPDKYKVIIRLRYFDKLSFKEIATELNIKETNAKVMCFRGIEKMRISYYNLK
jgi:RNA polymerase sigma-70 factor (ECF subfamily)